MSQSAAKARDTSIRTYQAKRDFHATPEPAPGEARAGTSLSFVVQKHAARKLHWDFRLEHGGVLWSWAVPKGPSLDPADKRLAVRVEDHPLDYAGFSGVIPAGNYGAGQVEIWDAGTWEPRSDPEAGLAAGELKFTLKGSRLRGNFVLVRLRDRSRAENWLLLKERDAFEEAGADAPVLEERRGPPSKSQQRATLPGREAAADPGCVAAREAAAPEARPRALQGAPAMGAMPGPLPDEQKPELATLVDEPPEGGEWLSEVKFDGYRLFARKHGRHVTLITRNGLDWTGKLPELARAIGRLKPDSLLIDGELVALRDTGLSSFADLQAALANGGSHERLYYYAFDLLHRDGWDLRPCALRDRKALLEGLTAWQGMLRFSDHLAGETPKVRVQACRLGLEGIICKRADAPYRGARTHDWVKVKCQGRDEFVVLGWTPPAGSRTGLGSVHLGVYDGSGKLHYVGGVGTGFDERELRSLSRRLLQLASTAPEGLLYLGEPPDPHINWVRPELVAEVQYVGWTGFARLRHAVWLGIRQDKASDEVVRDMPEPGAKRLVYKPRARVGGSIVHAPAPKRGVTAVGGSQLTHADRELWPGITKQDLARYWQAIAAKALNEVASRPLALLRCPQGIGGERFFQKHGSKGMPAAIRAGETEEGPYLSIEREEGLLAFAQIAALEVHGWGAPLDDPLHPDRMVFDLDPGPDVPFTDVVRAALDLRERLKRLQLESFCRTTGGKGLHVVVPLDRAAGWDAVKLFARDLARRLEEEEPTRFVSTMPKAKRRKRILIDWLRNGAGATAVCSFSPRARLNAPVATPLAWREVVAGLDPQAFTIATVPERLARQRTDPWAGFARLRQGLPTRSR